MFHTMKCYMNLVGAYIRGVMVNRWSFLFVLFAVMLINFTTFISIWLILKKFGNIRGWTFGQIVFIFILSLLTYGIRNLFFYKFTELGNMVQRGELDMVLTKPLNPFIFVMSSRFEMGGLAYIFLGIFLFFLFIKEFHIAWSLKNITLYIFSVISGALIQGAITILINVTAFFFHDGRGVNDFYYSLREYIWYPVSLYGKVVRLILFFIVPLAFASYIPAGVFLHNADYSIYPGWMWQLSLLSGPVLFIISYCFWNFGLKHYYSTGS